MKKLIFGLIGLLSCCSFVDLKAPVYIYNQTNEIMSHLFLGNVRNKKPGDFFTLVLPQYHKGTSFEPSLLKKEFNFRLIPKKYFSRYFFPAYSVKLIPNQDNLRYDVYKAGKAMVTKISKIDPSSNKIIKSLGFNPNPQEKIKNETKSNIFVHLIDYDGKATSWVTIKPLEEKPFNILKQKNFVVKNYDGTKTAQFPLESPGKTIKISFDPEAEPLFAYRHYFKDSKKSTKVTQFEHAKAQKPERGKHNKKELVQFSNHTKETIYVQTEKNGKKHKIKAINKWNKPGKKLLTVHPWQYPVVSNHNSTHSGYIEKPNEAKDWLTCEIHSAPKVHMPQLQKFVIGK